MQISQYPVTALKNLKYDKDILLHPVDPIGNGSYNFDRRISSEEAFENWKEELLRHLSPNTVFVKKPNFNRTKWWDPKFTLTILK